MGLGLMYVLHFTCRFGNMNTMLGSMLRETGQALDRLGCRIIGNSAFKEQREYVTVTDAVCWECMLIYRTHARLSYMVNPFVS